MLNFHPSNNTFRKTQPVKNVTHILTKIVDTDLNNNCLSLLQSFYPQKKQYRSLTEELNSSSLGQSRGFTSFNTGTLSQIIWLANLNRSLVIWSPHSAFKQVTQSLINCFLSSSSRGFPFLLYYRIRLDTGNLNDSNWLLDLLKDCACDWRLLLCPSNFNWWVLFNFGTWNDADELPSLSLPLATDIVSVLVGKAGNSSISFSP